MHEVPPGPPDQARRLERYRHEHPDVDIEPPGAGSAVWRAFRDGNLIAYGFTLMVFLERLEALPEPLGGARDFGLHLPARNSLVLLRAVPRGPPSPPPLERLYREDTVITTTTAAVTVRSIGRGPVESVSSVIGRGVYPAHRVAGDWV